MIVCSNTTDEDLYGLMGVEPDASVQDIQRSYRKLCLKCHPDKFPDDENKGVLQQKTYFLTVKPINF